MGFCGAGWVRARRHYLDLLLRSSFSRPPRLFVACAVLRHRKRRPPILRQSWINLFACQLPRGSSVPRAGRGDKCEWRDTGSQAGERLPRSPCNPAFMRRRRKLARAMTAASAHVPRRGSIKPLSGYVGLYLASNRNAGREEPWLAVNEGAASRRAVDRAVEVL